MSRRQKEECFGLPRGNAILGLFLGLIIIIWGLNELGYLKIEMWPSVVVIFGVLVVIGALYGLIRKK